MEISVILPVFNEEGNVPILYKKLKPILNKISKGHEIIFVDDGSSDNSPNKLLTLRKTDKKVKVITFSRNFGHMSAISAGLSHSTGKKVVIMDADLQDPPTVILKMYKKSSEGFDVVYGVKKKRKESMAMQLLFRLFYLIQTRVTNIPIPANAGTFSILDRRVVNVLKDLPEKK